MDQHRPIIGAIYTPGDGDECEMKAIGPTHVVVTWLRSGVNRRCIYTRAHFDREFTFVRLPARPVEVGHQGDLFSSEGPPCQPHI